MQQDTTINLHVFMSSILYSCQISKKFSFSPQIFKKYSNTKLHESPSGTSWVPCRWTDRHDKANGHFSQYCESA